MKPPHGGLLSFSDIFAKQLLCEAECVSTALQKRTMLLRSVVRSTAN
jgi:hypothetical protein